MKLLDKFQAMAGVRAELDGLGIRPFGAVTEKILSPTEALNSPHPGAPWSAIASRALQ